MSLPSSRGLLYAALVTTCIGVSTASFACGEETPRMRILTTHVRTGDRVVVQFDAPVAPRERGDRWLTLVPEGSAEEFVGERVVIEVGAAEASISTGEEGAFELRLVDGSPRHLSRVVARTRVEVAHAVLVPDEAPAWYW